MVIVYFALSFFASIVGAISGIGGGIIIKPFMDMISPFSIETIKLLSGTTVLCMTATSLLKNRKSDIKIDHKKSLFLAVGSILGGFLGEKIFSLIAGYNPGAYQSMILIFMNALILFFTLNKNRIKSYSVSNIFVCVIIGLLLGMISTFLGIGGGPINIAIFAVLFSMNAKESALNSLFVIFCSQLTSLILTVATNNIPNFEPHILVLMATGGVSGGLIGSLISKKLSLKGVSNIFILMLVLILIISIINYIKFVTV